MERHRRQKILIIVLAGIAIIEAIVIFGLLLSRPKRPAMKVRPAAPVVEKGRIAIVLDDWGYSLNNLAALRQIKYPLTLSILPNLAYSKRINQEGRALGFEVILHLPMEPREKLNLEQNTIMTNMDEKTIKEILASDLSSINYARGISNHMGSAAVNDLRTMTIIFTELKKRGLYFLDSYVSSEEVTSGLAAKMGLSFARRNVFLDNKNEPEYIKGQIYQLKVKARINGKAIGIGHDRKLTLQVLKEIMPQLEKEGYRFVAVSELVK